jgi:hypothetical protein
MVWSKKSLNIWIVLFAENKTLFTFAPAFRAKFFQDLRVEENRVKRQVGIIGG